MYRREARDFDEWRAAARDLLAAAVEPTEITWSDWRTPTLGELVGAPVAGTQAGADVAAGRAAAAVPSVAAGRPTAAASSVAAGRAAAATPSVTAGPSVAARPDVAAGRAAAAAPSVAAGLGVTAGPSVTAGPVAAAGPAAAAPGVPHARNATAPAISRRLLRLLEDLACYRDAGRWELMYRLTWRVLNENRGLLDNDADADVQRARTWEKAIHRDVHKMHAFVRFHETDPGDGDKRYVAWFEPMHEILRATAPFFERRFPNMRWMIATPDGAAVWNGDHTEFIESPLRSRLPREDSTHSLWRTYYRNICNVARINPTVMQRDMPRRYWQHLPEASEIKSLLSDGHRGAPRTPAKCDDLRIPQAIARSLERIAPPADSPLTCRLCDLWRHATQAVVGEGPVNAAIMLVGEQPGDEEDLKGRPFVGPAGQVLDAILVKAGLNRAQLFVTNSVKHFKWEPRGKRRLHERPDQQEVRACGKWLDREIANVAPRVIVALGATAIRAVTGSSEKIEDARQHVSRHPRGALIVCTYHPSAILRSEGDRKLDLAQALEEDLRRAASLLS